MPDNISDDIELNFMPGAPDLTTPRKKTGGKTSVEAAVEYLEQMDEQKYLFDMDALERSALRNAMGFDFEITFAPRKIFVHAVGSKKLRTHVKLVDEDIDDEGNVIPERIDARLADACIRLKTKFDAAQEAKA